MSVSDPSGTVSVSDPSGAPAELEFHRVSKRFGPTLALDSFSRRLEPGKVNALMGKNGSGKSTLVKIIAGVIQPTSGEVWLDGKLCNFRRPQDAFSAGIVTVHQELSLIPDLSIGENILLGRLLHRKRFGLPIVDWPGLHKRASALLEDMGLQLDSRRLVSSLSVGQQQVVEIVKAMSYDPRLLLLDEPTSALATREVKQLFALIDRLRERGVTMVYITHRMSELFEVCDTCTILRDGVHIGTLKMADTNREEIVQMMFGDEAHATRPPRRPIERDTPVLEVKNLTRPGHFQNISFRLYPGEILGFAGLLGSGRTEILRAVFGADQAVSGTVWLKGKDMSRATPSMMRAIGLGYTPENRKEVGLVQTLPTADNLCMASQTLISPHGLISRKKEKPFIDRQIKELGIKAGPTENPVSSLSGGNQQKVVIGKWMNTEPSVMFFDEPSRGVDVHAKRQIFDIIWKKATAGLAAIFVSTELEEVLEVADRILVIRDGAIVAEVDPIQITLADLYGLCMEGSAP